MNDRTLLAPLRSIARGAFPGIRYLGIYEYVVNSSNGTDYELVPTDPTAKIPSTHAKLRPGIPGLTQVMPKGALVLLQFINGDSTRPCIVSVPGPDDAGFTPTSLGLDCSGAMSIGASASGISVGAAGGRVLRDGEAVVLTGVFPTPGAPNASFVVTINPAIETVPGAPGTGFSKVSA